MAAHVLPVIAPNDFDLQIACPVESWVRTSVEEFLARRSESTAYSRPSPEEVVQSMVGEVAESKRVSQ